MKVEFTLSKCEDLLIYMTSSRNTKNVTAIFQRQFSLPRYQIPIAFNLVPYLFVFLVVAEWWFPSFVQNIYSVINDSSRYFPSCIAGHLHYVHLQAIIGWALPVQAMLPSGLYIEIGHCLL